MPSFPISSLWKTPPNMKTPEPAAGADDPPAPLQTAWRVASDAGEPVAVVRVRDLQGAGALPVGRDAWGRPDRPQPVLLSSEVSFARPFGAASRHDKVDQGDTVHYGTLSKALLGTLELCDRDRGQGRGQQKDSKAAAGVQQQQATKSPRTSDVFELLWVRMTGRVVDGSRVALPPDQVPLLDATGLRSLSLTIRLPKASLLGAGVSLTTTASFRDDLLLPVDGDGEEGGGRKNPLKSYSRSLRIHGLHVPTLVGVNANERAAKQMLVADVEIDKFDVVDDVHSDVERTVVDAMEASSFETLEALGTHIAQKILDDFRIGDNPQTMRDRGWQVKVCLEKPIAVPFAECPAVEIRMGG
ncbi:Dihydroneopterin aldolase-domain-containing protein [Xylariomycetidae sp. FL2044]|nr:Dihydroneopterin aldolase-domain-containing protein [Xylariomycetidae sp. FL2044]